MCGAAAEADGVEKVAVAGGPGVAAAVLRQTALGQLGAPRVRGLHYRFGSRGPGREFILRGHMDPLPLVLSSPSKDGPLSLRRVHAPRLILRLSVRWRLFVGVLQIIPGEDPRVDGCEVHQSQDAHDRQLHVGCKSIFFFFF